MKNLLCIIAAGILCTVMGCNNTNTETTTTGDSTVEATEAASAALNFTVTDFKQQLTPGCDSCPQVTASIPVASGSGPVAEKINNAVLNVLAGAIGDEGVAYNALDSLFIGFIDGYKEMRAGLEDDTPIGWEATIKGNVVQQSDSLINIRLETFVYTGGAHLNTNTFSLLFDPSTGNKLTIVNLVNNLHTLTRLAETKFREQYKIPAKTPLNDSGFMFDKNRFVLPANIFCTDDGLLLHYNRYEIAPYVMGAQEVLLPYAAIKPYLYLHQ